jgi:hypothetical protein
MADPVDELEVLVSLDLGPLEDDLEEAVDKMDRLDDQTTDDVEEELDDAAESADDLSNAIDGADARAIDIDVDDSEVQAAENAVEDLDGKEANVDVDVDRDTSGGGRGDRVRLPGELDEVVEVGQAFGQLTNATKGLVTATGAAVAAIGAAGGLAAAATKLSHTFGDAEVRQEVNALTGELDTLGAVMAQEFRPVVESQVVPAAKNLADSLASAADEAADFTEVIIGALRPGGGGIREDVQESGAGGATFLPTVGPTPTPGQQSGRDTPLDTIRQPGLSNVAGSLKQIVGSLKRIEGFGGSLGEALKRADLLEAAGLPKEQVIEARISALESARQSVSELAKQAERGTPAFDVLAGEVSDIQTALEQARATLKDLGRTTLEGVAPQPADASEVSAAGREDLDTGSVKENIPDRVSAPQQAAPSQKQVRRLVSFRAQIRNSFSELSQLGQIGARSFLSIGKGVGQTLGQILTLQKGVKSIEGAFKQLGASVLKSLQRIVEKMIQAVTTAAALRAAIAFIPGLNAIGGASSFKGLLGGVLGFEKGGVVKKKMLGVIGEGTESEAVMPLSNLKSMVQKSAQIGAAQIAGAVPSGGGSGRSLATRKAGSEEVTMDASTINIEVPVETVATAASIGRRTLRRKGRVGR